MSCLRSPPPASREVFRVARAPVSSRLPWWIGPLNGMRRVDRRLAVLTNLRCGSKDSVLMGSMIVDLRIPSTTLDTTGRSWAS